MKYYFIEQLFLILRIHFTTGSCKYVCRNFHCLIVKFLQKTDYIFSVAGIINDCITGSVIYLCKRYLFLVLQRYMTEPVMQ